MRPRFFAWMACVLGFCLVACSDSASDDGGDDDTGGTAGADTGGSGGTVVTGGTGGTGGSGDSGGTGGTGDTGGAGGSGDTGGTGTGGSAGSSDGPTVEEHCEEIIGIYCDRSFNECQMMEGYEECLASAVPVCCGSRCDEPSPAPQSEVDACSTDMQLMTCAQIMNATFPESCAGVLAAD
jgi:hypothetical protein